MTPFQTKLFSILVLVAAFGLLAGCGAKDAGNGGDDAAHDDHGDDDHHAGKHGGAIVVSDDHKAHFEIVHDEDAKKITLYVMDENMAYRGIGDTPVLNLVGPDGSVKVTGKMGAGDGEMAAAEWHFTHDLLAGEPEGRFRIKIGTTTYMPACEHAHDGHDDHDDHDHNGDEHHDVGPHDGMVESISCPAGDKGYIELKLHDDKGDLELWIASDEKITKPMDLPIGTKITVTFTEPKATTVTLQARNKDRNEDEDDTANNRDGKTNYFIFPGDTGADATWLMGGEFEGSVTVTFSDGDKKFTTEAFELIPHTHGAGGGHDHDHK